MRACCLRTHIHENAVDYIIYPYTIHDNNKQMYSNEQKKTKISMRQRKITQRIVIQVYILYIYSYIVY